MKKFLLLLAISISIIGIFDAGYLTFEHYHHVVPQCLNGIFFDCGAVLKSKYSVVLGIPLALIGLIYYLVTFFIASGTFLTEKKFFRYALLIVSAGGLLGSIYFFYLQIVVIGAICLYCTVSGISSLGIFLLSQVSLAKERKFLFVELIGFVYVNMLRPVIFLFDSEFIHVFMVRVGETMGKLPGRRLLSNFFVRYEGDNLKQNILGINFSSPIGLSAGFDYVAGLTQVLPDLGFGFGSVGTITNFPYEGNPRPRLGRLIKSRSLMVNKGFANPGAEAVAKKLSKLSFDVPVGISVGRTNMKHDSVKEAIEDIVKAFKTLEKAKIGNSYYELNVSCPNLFGKIDFYEPRSLEFLLEKIDSLKIARPIFVKMPISQTNEKTVELLEIISKHCPDGVIIGNLQTDRKNSELDADELKKFPIGNFSGRPTFKRSNELISLCRKKFGDRFVIIGCGGVFSAKDAFEKIVRGANLVQMITGLIFEGPLTPAKINFDLEDLLAANGFENISEAVGTKID